MRTVNAINDDLEMLIKAGFILDCGNGVYAVTHWEQQNHVPKSKYTPTVFVEEYARLELTENDCYKLS